MNYDANALYRELHPYFQDRVRRNEPLARHSTFGVGGPAAIRISLATSTELLDLVRLRAEKHAPLLIAGNGTNVFYADDGVRGIVVHIAFGHYHLEEQGETTALLLADAGVSWPRLMCSLTPRPGE